MVRRSAVAALVVAAGLATASCGGSSGSPAAGPTSGTAAASSAPSSTTAASSGAGAAALQPIWPTYHGSNTRRGYADLGPKPSNLHRQWQRRLDGAVYASPLVLGSTIIAATENDTVYGLSRSTGAVLWRTHLGTPVPQSALPCGNIDPLGITGTPAYDTATHSVFVVAELANPPRHQLVALDPATGRTQWRRSIDIRGMNATVEQQRPALAVANGRVYVAFGGLAGDCGDYHGYVIGSATDGKGPLVSYRTRSSRMAGTWAPSGPAVDSGGHLYIAVGNGAATSPPYDGSDSIIRLSPTLQEQALFAPNGWESDNASDLDLGSTGPLLLSNGYLLADGKRGVVYLLHPDHLGGVGGPAATLTGCQGYGGAAANGATAYLPCRDGVMAVDTAGFRLRRLWQHDGVPGSPVVTPSAVWTLDPQAGVLYALNAKTGATLSTIDVGTTTRFATPALAPGMIVVPTETGITAVGNG